MHCTIHFFAIEADAVARRFKQQSEEIASRVAELMQASRDVDPQEFEESRQLAHNVCLGRLGTGEPEAEINILCWICEVVGEKIDIPPFNFFNSLGFLEDIAIWPLFQNETPPFPVPKCAAGLPDVGYMSRTSIRQHVESNFAQLPECDDPEADSARDDLLGVLESLQEDDLDLVAILV